MLFSAPNLVFVTCVPFNHVFWYLLLLVQYACRPPFFGPLFFFFMVCGNVQELILHGHQTVKNNSVYNNQ